MSVSRPSRIEVARIYSKRVLRWRRNSSPFISGDAFADLCDFVYKPPRFRRTNRGVCLKDAKTIYCKSHDLDEMLSRHAGEINARIIITGNSDFEFHSIPREIPKSTRALFLQNSFISDNEFIFTIPIGLENFRLGVNGNPKFLRRSRRRLERSNRVLFGPLSATHPIRDIVIQRFKTADPRWELLTSRLSPKEYNRLASRFRMIAAVRGNGVDTHRLWEALYRGVVPIVVLDSWWESLQNLFPQVFSISDWSINEIEKAIHFKANDHFNPATIDALWMPFWEQRINYFLKN